MSYLLTVVATMTGSISLLLFGLFVYGYSLTLVDLGYGRKEILAWDGFLCLLFFLQHSGMIRKPFRRCLAGVVPYHYHGAFYTIASAAALFLLVLCWQDTGQMLYSLDGIERWIARGVFFASLLGMFWGMCVLHSFDVFGIRPVLDGIRSSQEKSTALVIRGPYRWVRHPLYFFTLVLIWSAPDVTVDRLLFNVLFSAWIVLGTILEERDLVVEFGEVYRGYQRNVPMLLPCKLPSADLSGD